MAYSSIPLSFIGAGAGATGPALAPALARPQLPAQHAGGSPLLVLPGLGARGIDGPRVLQPRVGPRMAHAQVDGPSRVAAAVADKLHGGFAPAGVALLALLLLLQTHRLLVCSQPVAGARTWTWTWTGTGTGAGAWRLVRPIARQAAGRVAAGGRGPGVARIVLGLRHGGPRVGRVAAVPLLLRNWHRRWLGSATGVTWIDSGSGIASAEGVRGVVVGSVLLSHGWLTALLGVGWLGAIVARAKMKGGL
jgi:hypothetical protein